mmetsp:Transcript_53095/g.143175  ORF Transcript_53095/g.143175 Transcript_53095/m.143175 type:complete len:301 (+) Transcript_53095:72-974(+)
MPPSRMRPDQTNCGGEPPRPPLPQRALARLPLGSGAQPPVIRAQSAQRAQGPAADPLWATVQPPAAISAPPPSEKALLLTSPPRSPPPSAPPSSCRQHSAPGRNPRRGPAAWPGAPAPAPRGPAPLPRRPPTCPTASGPLDLHHTCPAERPLPRARRDTPPGARPRTPGRRGARSRGPQMHQALGRALATSNPSPSLSARGRPPLLRCPRSPGHGAAGRRQRARAPAPWRPPPPRGPTSCARRGRRRTCRSGRTARPRRRGMPPGAGRCTRAPRGGRQRAPSACPERRRARSSSRPLPGR